MSRGCRCHRTREREVCGSHERGERHLRYASTEKIRVMVTAWSKRDCVGGNVWQGQTTFREICGSSTHAKVVCPCQTLPPAQSRFDHANDWLSLPSPLQSLEYSSYRQNTIRSRSCWVISGAMLPWHVTNRCLAGTNRCNKWLKLLFGVLKYISLFLFFINIWSLPLAWHGKCPFYSNFIQLTLLSVCIRVLWHASLVGTWVTNLAYLFRTELISMPALPTHIYRGP